MPERPIHSIWESYSVFRASRTSVLMETARLPTITESTIIVQHDQHQRDAAAGIVWTVQARFSLMGHRGYGDGANN